MNKEADLAWDICSKVFNSFLFYRLRITSILSYSIILFNFALLKATGTPDGFALLQLVANDSYRMGQFLVAAKCFHMLDRYVNATTVPDLA